MQVFVHPLHGAEKSIGTVFISYVRNDAEAVADTIVREIKRQGIPFLIDVQEVGSNKVIDSIHKMIEDSACGVIALSPETFDSHWIWYETGILEGAGKKIIPYSLISGPARQAFYRTLPDFVRQYGIQHRLDDLIRSIREETFVAGKIANVDGIRPDIFSELKEVHIDLIFDNMPREVSNMVKFGVLICKFGTQSSIDQLAPQLQSDGTILNIDLLEASRVEFSNGSKSKFTLVVPVHKRLGTRFKFFVDVAELFAIDHVMAYLTAAGARDVKQSGSANTQRIYFLAPEGDIPVVTGEDQFGITDHYIFPS